MKLTRNQIVGAWLWIHIRPTESLYMFRKYHMHSVRSLAEAKRIAAVVRDIDAAKAKTCARDEWRAYRSNVLSSPGRYLPYRPYRGLSGTAALIDAVRKKEVLLGTYGDHLRHWAPATARKYSPNA
jgi:hypothetical protein